VITSPVRVRRLTRETWRPKTGAVIVGGFVRSGVDQTVSFKIEIPRMPSKLPTKRENVTKMVSVILA